MKDLLLSFPSIFVFFGTFGLLPLFLTMTEGIDGKQREKVI